MASGVGSDARAAARVMERCELLGQISEEDGILFRPYGSEAMRCVNRLVGYWMRDAGITRAVEELGYPAERLPSRAGHDAAAVAEIAPIAMLSVRCRGGINHNPAESVEPEDVAAAIGATSRFLELLANCPATWGARRAGDPTR